jgi:transcriptional regulator with XRE-family HTH domain
MVARWEKGRVIPRPETLQKLAQLLEISEEELLSGKPSAKLEAVIEDPEMIRLLTQIRNLSERDRESLKAVIEAMLMRSQIKAVMAETAS